MKENRIVPDSLADLLVTFTLSGYYDATLRDAVDQAPRRPLASTSWLSAHQTFPDAFYEFHRTGRMEWRVTPTMLALQRPGRRSCETSACSASRPRGDPSSAASPAPTRSSSTSTPRGT